MEDSTIVEVTDCISSVYSLIKEKLLSKNISFIFDEESDKYLVKAKKAELHQVFIGLISNAVDALEQTKEPVIKIRIKVLSDRLFIYFIDNGPGVLSKAEDNIMKPFFTTKDEEKGTGLGLSIAKSILASHGGDLNYSRTNEQTYFKVSLPYIDQGSLKNLKNVA